MTSLQSHEVDGYISITGADSAYPIVHVKNNHASAKIALHGAHVMDFTPHDEKPVIFTSSEAIYQEGKAIRGGIPVCWPWFNAHPSDPSNPDLPSHGFARNAFWQLFRSFAGDDLTTLIFTFSKDDLHAELTVEISKELTLSLKTTNTGNSSQTIGGALHSYFSISDISQISISGLENTAFHDSLTGQAGEDNKTIYIKEEIDRIYQQTASVVILKDEQWKREISVEKTGSNSTVIWNPWIEKSATMGDLGNEEYKQFVCIETANALEDVYRVAPGGSHTMSTKISTNKL